MPSTSSRNERNAAEPSGKYLSTLRAVGFTGAIVTTLTVGLTATFIYFVSGHLIDYLEPLYRLPKFPRKAGPYISAILALLLWLPLVPVLLAATFLPVRLAWINGRVTVQEFIDSFGDSFKRAVATLKATARSLLMTSLPFIGVSALLFQMQKASVDPQLLKFVASIALVTLGFILWQAAALVCAVPIAIVSQCTAHAAATECKFVIRSRHRVLIFLIGLGLASCATGAIFINLLPWETWQIFLALVAVAAIAWVLGIFFGVVCIDASIEYLRNKASNSPGSQTAQFESRTIIPGVDGILANGQPVTIQIQNLHLPPDGRVH